MSAYYNEINKFCAEWLRNLIAAGHLPAGDVDERSIEGVTPNDLAGYNLCLGNIKSTNNIKYLRNHIPHAEFQGKNNTQPSSIFVDND